MHDLSGTWRGHYEQAGNRHGISMVVAQRGQSLVGSMRDEDTLLMCGGPATANGSAADGSAAEVGEASIVTSLPETSIVEGDVEGTAVAFVKRYQGAQRTSVWIGEHTLHLEIPSHSVRYEGVLVEAGAVLRGQWRIPALREDGREESGAFELRRQPRTAH